MRRFCVFIFLFVTLVANAGQFALYQDARSWTGGCYIAITGDSITGGGGGGGAGINALPVAISNASGGLIRVINKSIGSTRWSWTNGDWLMSTGDQITPALTNKPRWLMVHLGVNNGNDMFLVEQFVPGEWPQIETNLSTLAFRCSTNNTKLLVSEIMPAYTNIQAWAYPGARNYNEYIARWCATNQYNQITRCLFHHDAFAVLNPESGFLDWLEPIYQLSTTDGLHLSQAAYDKWGPHIVSNMMTFLPDPLAINGRQITRVLTNAPPP